jgi:hypothetical protein
MFALMDFGELLGTIQKFLDKRVPSLGFAIKPRTIATNHIFKYSWILNLYIVIK